MSAELSGLISAVFVGQQTSSTVIKDPLTSGICQTLSMVMSLFPVRDFTGTKLTALTYSWTKLSFKIVLMHLMLLGGREKITKHFP